VEVVDGPLGVGEVAVEHAANPTGPRSEIGTISWDGESYAGVATAPAGGNGFIRVVGP
jgi:hypothetical protein